MNKIRIEKKIGAFTLSFETGFLAKQAAGCVMTQYGDTVVLNAVAAGPARPGIDFFPLMCDYRERTSAAGKFPGGFLKREGRPSMKETLTSRLMDRPIRPLFPKGYADEVQCQSFVMASDRLNDGDVLAMNGCSAALLLSPLPFLGPVASVRLGRIDDQWVPFPTAEGLESSDLDLIVSGSRESVTEPTWTPWENAGQASVLTRVTSWDVPVSPITEKRNTVLCGIPPVPKRR